MASSNKYRKRRIFKSGGAQSYLYKSVSVLFKTPKKRYGSRIKEVSKLIKEFKDESGELPAGESLELLADYILIEELSNKSPYKVRHYDYPILSTPQLVRRKSVEDSIYSVDLKNLTTDGEFLEDPGRKDYGLEYRIENEYQCYSELNAGARVVSYMDKELASKVGSGKAPALEHWRDAEYQEWALLVKERDGWECQNPACRSRVREMHAHHLESWNSAVSLRYELSNGITLCRHCHMRFHFKYGFGNNTRIQFENWIESEAEVHGESV